MADLSAALSSAFSEASGGGETETAAPATETAEAPVETAAAEPEAKAEEPAKETAPTEESFHNPSREELELINKNPALKNAYESFRRGFSNKTRELSEQRKKIERWQAFVDAAENPETQRQAIEAMARSVGLNIQPHDIPQRQEAAKVADQLSEKWSGVVGPEAAQMLRPLIEETALAAVQGTLQPLQEASKVLQDDARNRQADAQVEKFRALAKSKGWSLDPETERTMAQIGRQFMPASPIQSVEEGVQHLEKLYRLATADRAESDIEKRVIERMQTAAKSAEPARGVPSTGREKRTAVTKDMSWSEAFDVAKDEAMREHGWK